MRFKAWYLSHRETFWFKWSGDLFIFLFFFLGLLFVSASTFSHVPVDQWVIFRQVVQSDSGGVLFFALVVFGMAAGYFVADFGKILFPFLDRIFPKKKGAA